jgi:polyisoprenyl-phosphate glycosyltransferase
MNTDSLSVVIPVFNSARCLPELLLRLTAVLSETGFSHEIVLVDDGSRDESWRVICEQSRVYPSVKAIRLMRNCGQANATLCGLESATGAFVATMDDDLQHPPDQLPVLFAALRDHPEVDCVLGYFETKKHSWYRNAGSRLIQYINARAFGLPPGIRTSSFRVMRRATAAALVAHRTVNASIMALLFDSTHRLLSIPVCHAARFEGTSNYSLARQLRLAFDNLCNVTMLPLRMVSALGFIICSLSMVFVFSVLWRYFFHRIGVPGWATLSIITAFTAGVILLALGVMGEYMVRVLREVRGFPRYVERERVGFHS